MPRLSLYLLGPPRIERDGVPIRTDTRKAIALLAYLAVTGESYQRDALVNLLWPEYDQSRGLAALRRTLSDLRQALVDPWLEIDRESVGLCPDAGVWLDVDQFHSDLAQCLAHGHPASEVCPACLSPLGEAAALYRGDFLAGFSLRDSLNFDDWQFFQGDALRREFASTLERLVRGHTAQGAFEPALRYARRLLALDPVDEEAHVQLMRLYVRTGQRAAALRQYEVCVKHLREQLGAAPQASTTALYRAIYDGRAPPAPAGLVPPHLEMSPQEQAGRLSPARGFLEGERRIVTVLVADASASFRGMRDLGPEDEAVLAHRLFQTIADVLARYGGQAERLLGRSVLATFGRVQTRENDPELAVRAAVEIRREARKLGLSVATGLHTGEVYLDRSAVEAGGGQAFALVGAVVDLAVRLGGKASAGQVLVTRSTYRLTRRAFAYTPFSLSLEGLDEPLSVYQVDRLLPQPEKARGIEGLRAELVGREEELTRLKGALGRALEGQGQIVALIGEAGIGKSRLVAELRDDTLAPDRKGPTPLWLEGRCLELGRTASYAPFIDLLRGHLAWHADDDELGRGQHIAAALQTLSAHGHLAEEHVHEIGSLLGRLLSARFGSDWDERLTDESPEAIRRRTFLAISDLIVAFARERPVVLVLEDLHWADDLSLDLLSLLMEQSARVPLLLLCIYRLEREHRSRHLATAASQQGYERFTEVRLHELTRSQGQRLVVSLLGTEGLPAPVVDSILARSQGYPFYIEETVRSLIDAGILVREGDVWHARDSMDATVVPEGVQDVILSRFDHLQTDLQHVLQVASVLGRVFRRRVLERALEEPAGLEGFLWELEERELIYQERAVPEVEYSFRHVLMQEAIYGNIVRQRRKAIHRRAAEAIEALYGDNLDEACERLAYHYDRAEVPEKAVTYLLRAGRKAQRSYANEAAIAYLTRGLELLRSTPHTPDRDRQEVDLLLALGVPLVFARGHSAPEVQATYARAQELCARVCAPADHFQVLMGLRRSHFMRGELRTAYELGDQLLAVAREVGDAVHLSRAHAMHGETLYWLGAFGQALEQYDRALVLYDPQEHRTHMVLFGNDTGVACQAFGSLALWQLGHPDQALKRVEDASALAREWSHPFNLTFVPFLAAMLYQLRQEAPAARESAERVIQQASEHGFPLFVAWGTFIGGWALAASGQPEAGIARMHEGMAAFQAAGARGMGVYRLALLAEAYGRKGETAEGLRLAQEALALVEGTQEHCCEAELCRLYGELCLRQGNEAKAEAALKRAIEVARRQDARSWELRAATHLARLWQRQGKGGEAADLLRGTHGWFTEGLDTADLREAREVLGTLAYATCLSAEKAL